MWSVNRVFLRAVCSSSRGNHGISNFIKQVSPNPNAVKIHHRTGFRCLSSGPEEEEAEVIDMEKMNSIIKNRRLVLIDVRRPEEIKEEGCIPTAVNINVEKLENALKLNDVIFEIKYGFKKPTPEDQVIVYCRSGKRSTDAGKIFLKYNYNNVLNFKGSWKEWSENHPEDSRKPPARSES